MSAPDPQDSNTYAVDPARLARGRWCHRTEKTVGEGDIIASYSANRIGMCQPVRKPFTWKGSLLVCVSITTRGEAVTAEAYRLMHPTTFDGAAMTYAAKVADSDAARADRSGFYHGMSVRHAGVLFVLCGPPLRFVPGQTQQLTLFG